MDNRLHPLRASQRLLTYLVCGLIAWQPLLPAISATINTVTSGTNMDKAANGVPVVNIATPNGAGISHNQFKDYNVGKEGLILNNATGQLNKTQLGGYIQNNTNLTAGREAKGIINEVTGGSRSQLQGYTEVAGKAANVIVANPYGITCSGCGFINTPNATLTTGKPVFDAKGNLQSLDVSKGTITVEGQGLDASQSDALAIISRATEVNAAIHAKDLKVVAGANRVGSDGSVTAIAGEGAAPVVAVDTGALGGMYANRIHLVSGEKGVGVNLGNLNARQGDITLDANGKLVLNNSLSSGALTVKADSAELGGDNKASGTTTVTAQNGIALNSGSLVSDKTVALDGGERVQLSGAKVTAGEDIRLAGAELNIDKNSTADAAGDIGLTAKTKAASLNVQGDTADAGSPVVQGKVNNAGQLTAGKNITLDADSADNSGSLVAKGSFTGTAKQLTNRGKLVGDTLVTDSDTLNNHGEMLAGQKLKITANSISQGGTVSAKGNAEITARDSLENKAGGSISSDNGLAVKTAQLTNNGTLSAAQLGLESDAIINGGLLQGTQSLSLLSNNLDNQAAGSIYTTDDLALNLPEFTNSGLLSSGGVLQLSGDRLTNSGEINAASLTSDNTTLNNLAGGRLLAAGTMQLTNAQLDNAGQIAAGGLDVIAKTLTSSGGMQGTSGLSLKAETLTNQSGGELLSSGKFVLNSGELTNAGLLQGDSLSVTANNWHNSGNALSAQDAVVSVKDTLTNSGKILGQQGLYMEAGSTDNSGWLLAQVLTLQGDLVNSGLIQGTNALTLHGNHLSNKATGELLSAGTTDVQGNNLDNAGTLQSDKIDARLQRWQNAGIARATSRFNANISGPLENSGTLLSQNDFDLLSSDIASTGTLAAERLNITASQLSNSGLLQGNNLLALDSADIFNGASGQLISGGTLNLSPVQLTNAGLLQVAGDFSLTGRDFSNNGQVTAASIGTYLSGTLDNGVGGLLIARQQVDVHTNVLNNAGSIAAQQLNVASDSLQNKGLMQGSVLLTADFRQFDNLDSGQLMSGGDLRLSGTTANNTGLWQGKNLGYQFGSFANSGTVNGTASLTGWSDTLLDNSGNLLTGGDASVTANSLLNSGKIMADGLVLDVNSLSNSGLLQGSSSLNVQSTGELTQLTGGRALTDGELLLNAVNLSTAGILQGKSAQISADRWQHQGSLLTVDEFIASVSGELSNIGELLSQGAAWVTARNLVNNGSLLAGKAVTLNGSEINNRGTVQGDTLTITPARVSNHGSLIGLQSLTLESAAQPSGFRVLAIQTPTTRELINHAGGQLLTQGTLRIAGDAITNNGTWQGQQILLDAVSLSNGGVIQSADGLQLKLSDTLTSAEGSKITANGIAALSALSFTNQGQWIAKNLTLDATSLNNDGDISGVDALTVKLNDALTQQQGKTLLSGGLLDLQAASVDNAGRIQGENLSITTRTVNNNGRLQGDNSLLLTISGRLTNNASGMLLSQNGLTLTTPELYNYGLIQGTTGRITASNAVINSGKLLSSGELTFTTPQLTNSGWLQAAQLTLNAANATNSGTLLAEQQGTLSGNTLTNTGTAQGGSLAVNYQQLSNSGTLLGNTALNITAQQVSQQATGKLFSGGSLVLNSNGFDQLGQVVALGDATMKLINSLNVRGTLAAGGKLTVSSNNELVNNGVMQGQALSLSAGNVLTNNGTLTSGSGDSSISGSRITMNSAGSLQGGGNVTLTSGSDITLDGFTGTAGTMTLNAPGSIVNTALLYAAHNLYLLANSIKNQGGDILAGNSMWMQRDMAGNANSEILNTSGTIETTNGDITIKTGHLLNTRDGLSTSDKVSKLSVPSWAAGTNVNIPLSWFSPGDYGLYTSRSQQHHGHGDDWETHTGSYAPYPDADVQKIAFQTINVTVNANGGASRIAAGRDFNVQATQFDNFASQMLARNNMTLTGNQLNNKSWTDGTTTVYQIYRYGVGQANPARPAKNPPSYSSITSRSIAYTLDGSPVYETSGSGNVYRGVIQAGNNIVANFSQNISNTAADAHVSGTSNSLTSPTLNTLSQQVIVGSVQKQSLNIADKVEVNTPAWKAQVENALQQINGGGALVTDNGSSASLTNIVVTQKGNASLGNARDINHAGSLPEGEQPEQYQSKTVDSSAYPVPSSDNGYFVISSNPSSPYLITVNPKLNGLGQLDPALFNTLNQMLGVSPAAAPQETRSQYTDENQFLGSSYMLNRLNLNPEKDYRFLGDAAFDTRYVSNTVLNKTGNQYLNGMGSDLEQMRYLMDSAAAAQTSLGLQFGVALNAEQIAALDHSILWWETTTINGETVMVPKLYLSPKDVTVSNGSVITAKNVSLTGDNITNSGSTLLATNTLSLDSQNTISNLNDGLVKASGDLNLSAIGDINNVSSTFHGKTVAMESIDGSINNITLANPLDFYSTGKSGSVALKNIQSGSTALIDAEQDLALSAGNNITLIGASLSAGNNLLMKAWGDIAVNANQIANTSGRAGRSGLLGSAPTQTDTVNYQGSTVSSAGNLLMEAGHDLGITASDITSAGSATLSAANNLQLTAGKTSQNSRSGKKETHSTNVDRTTITADGNLSLSAGQDLISQAAALSAAGNAELQAGRDINLQAVATNNGSSWHSGSNSEIKEAVRQQSTEISSGGDITVQAGHDLNSNATQVVAQQDIAVAAGNNVNLDTATESDYYYKKEVSKGGGFLSKKTTTTIQEDTATREKGTLLSGNNVSVEAGKNILVNGSQVVGDDEVALKAGDNIDILAATNTNSSWRFSETKKSGLMGTGGIGISIGSSKTTHDLKQKGTTQSQSVSTVGSTGGNVSIASGGQVHLNGSDLVAGKGITVESDNVLVTAGHDKHITDEVFKQQTSGLTLALSGAVGSAINSAVAAAQTASEQSDGRLAALQGAKAALSGVQASQAARLNDAQGNTAASSVGIMLSLGAQSSKSQTHSEQDTTRSSTLNAGNNLTLKATGKGETASSGDINVEGGQLKAGNDVTLDAARDITLAAAKDTQKLEGSNSSKGGSIGIGLTAGSGGTGLTVSASMNASKGNEKGNGTSWNETNIDAGNQVSLISGRDTTLSGALVNGDKVVADVGRDLTLTSLQDSNNYDSKQQSMSAGVSFTWGVPGASASFSYSKDKMHSTYDSVQEQSGIYAGNGGFDITVGSHTQLNGAVIASNADAAKNSLDTGTLGFSDIQNEADYKVEHVGVGLSTGGGIGSQFAGNMASTLLAGAGGSGHAEGTTQSAVADGTIAVRDQANQKQDVAALSRDTANANGAINQIFDKEKEQKRLQTAQMIGEIGAQVADIARTEGQIEATQKAKASMATATDADRSAAIRKLQDAKADVTDDAIEKQMYNTFYNQAFTASEFGTGGSVQRAITAATAVVQGLAGGDMAAAIAGGAAPFITNEIAKLIPETNTEGRALAHAAVNAALAAVQGKDMAVAAAGAATGELVGKIAKDAYGKDVSQLSETDKQTVSALATLASALAGGLIGGGSADTLAAAQTGKTVAENNVLGDGWGNVLSKGMADYGQGASSLGSSMVNSGATLEEVNAALSKNAKGDLPEGANITKVIVEGYTDGVLIAGAWYLGTAASVGKVVAGATIAEIANGTYQWVDINSEANKSLPEYQQKTWDYWGSASAAVTGALAPGRGALPNLGITLGGAVFTDGPDNGAFAGAGAGWMFGTGVGFIASPVFSPVLGSAAAPAGDIIGALGGEFISNAVKDEVNEKKK